MNTRYPIQTIVALAWALGVLIWLPPTHRAFAQKSSFSSLSPPADNWNDLALWVTKWRSQNGLTAGANIALTDCVSRSEASHERLRTLAQDLDAAMSDEALVLLGYLHDMSDVDLFARIMTTSSNMDIRHKAKRLILTRISGLRENLSRDKSEAAQFQEISAWLDAHRGEWTQQSQLEQALQRVQESITEWQKAGFQSVEDKQYQGDAEAYLLPCLELMQYQESRSIVPAVMQWLSIAPIGGSLDRYHLCTLLNRLQWHVGPLDVPDCDASKGLMGAKRDEVLKWWESVKELGPTEWRLRRMALRGHLCGNPADREGTARALAEAIKNGDDIEAFTAAEILSASRPGLPEIILPRPNLVTDHARDRMTAREGQLDYDIVQGWLRSQAAFQAYQWRLFAGDERKWIPKEEQYR